MKNIALLSAVLVLLPVFSAEGEFSSLREAEEVFRQNFSSSGDWSAHSISRRRSSMFISESVSYNYSGDVVGSSFTMHSFNSSGTIMAFPVGDFWEVVSFKYRRGGAVCDGLVVAVKVQISIPDSTADRDPLQRTVENMVKSGSSLSPAVGAKPGRLMPLKKTVAKRFGASTVFPIYDVKKGNILFVLGGVNAKRADETYLPVTRNGMSAAERKRERALSKQNDTSRITNGGVTTIYYPAGADPQRFIDLYNRGVR